MSSQTFVSVPPFNRYYPSIEDAGAEQQAFYKWLVSEFAEGRTPDVQGNLSYLFVRIYEFVGDFIQTRHYAVLAQWFDFLRTGYAEVPKIGGYLDTWQGDAALLVQNWEDAWRYKSRKGLDMDLIVNVRRHCSNTTLTAHDLHTLLHTDDGLTEWGRQHPDAVDREADQLLSHFRSLNNKDFLDVFFEQYAWRELDGADLARIADDCEYLVSVQRLKNVYCKYPRHEEVKRPLFSGVLMPWETTTNPPTKVGNGMAISITTRIRKVNPTVSMVRLSPAIQLAAVALCKRLLREAENNARDSEGLPHIGEGWVSETELFNIIRSAFPTASVVQHARPEWLSPQHLDVYLPEYSIGIEFQGAQHLSPVDYFGGERAFAQQRKRDARKKRLCGKNGCTLLEVFQEYSPDDVVGRVRSLVLQVRPEQVAVSQSTKPCLTPKRTAADANKGKCESCGKSSRVLRQIQSGQWVCRTCLREIHRP